jgi:hypothetical protein
MRLLARLLPLILLIAALAPAGASAAAPWGQVDQTLGGLAPAANLIVAEAKDGRCDAIHGLRADQRLAVASSFKLYVLAELARQIDAGTVSWDEQLPIEDDLRSMPSGDFAFLPAGTKRTIREYATAMIRDSDNTATDHLIHRLGRLNVEFAFGRFGHSDPQVNQPLLLTRELFAIKMHESATWMTDFVAAGGALRRTMLVRQIDPVRVDPTAGWGNWNGPTEIGGIEWFASARDLCTVLAKLERMSHQPKLAPLREILFSNPGGMPPDPAWARTGFKGGNEAGVLAQTWLLQRTDGRMFIVSAAFNDPHATPDSAAARNALAPVFTCLTEAHPCGTR